MTTRLHGYTSIFTPPLLISINTPSIPTINFSFLISRVKSQTKTVSSLLPLGNTPCKDIGPSNHTLTLTPVQAPEFSDRQYWSIRSSVPATESSERHCWSIRPSVLRHLLPIVLRQLKTQSISLRVSLLRLLFHRSPHSPPCPHSHLGTPLSTIALPHI